MLGAAGAAGAHENVPGHPVQVHPHVSPAQAAFDKLFWDIDDGVYPIGSRVDALKLLAWLRGAVPAGDVHRELQYRYMHCLLGFQHVAEGALDYAREGVAAARDAGDGASEAALRLCLGQQLVGHGDIGAARQEFERAAELARRSHDFNVHGIALVQRGHLRMDTGEVALGLQDLLDAQAVFEEGKVEFQIEFNLFSIAQAYRRIGDLDQADEYLGRVMDFGRARDDALVLGVTLVERARLRSAQGRHAEAEADLEEALALSRQRGSDDDVTMIHLALADVYNAASRPREALEALETASAGYARTGESPEPGRIEFATGVARSRLGQHQAALDAFDRALPALLDRDDMPSVMLLYQARAVSREALGDPAGALADLREYGRMRRDAVERITDQRVLALSHGFDARYRDLQNARLRLEQERTERLAAAERQKTPWRLASIALGGALVVLLVSLAVLQARRTLGLRRMASTDPLTGAANRRAIQQIATKTIAAADAPACLVLLDLDHFKQVNDRFGHGVGDQVLVRTVATWNTVLRQGDRLGRLGGEEFLVVLPGAGIGAGMQVARRLLEATRAMDLSDLGEGLQLTVSLGVAQIGSGDRTLEAVLERADAALYKAKDNGRDRIELAEPRGTEDTSQ